MRIPTPELTMMIPAFLRSLRAPSLHHQSRAEPTAESRSLSMRPTVYLPPALAERFVRRVQGLHRPGTSLTGCPALCGG